MSGGGCKTVPNMNKDASITFRLPQATRDALARAAEAERRSLSNLAVAVLSEWLEAHGHLPKARPAKRQAGRG